MVKTGTKSKKEIKQLKSEIIEDEVTPEEIQTELDPEILAALNSKRTKKSKIHEVDYVPELEREKEELGFDDSE